MEVLVKCERNGCQNTFLKGFRGRKYCCHTCKKRQNRKNNCIGYRKLRALGVASSKAAYISKNGSIAVQKFLKTFGEGDLIPEVKCKRAVCCTTFRRTHPKQVFCCAYCKELTNKVLKSFKRADRYKRLKDMGLSPKEASYISTSETRTNEFISARSTAISF